MNTLAVVVGRIIGTFLGMAVGVWRRWGRKRLQVSRPVMRQEVVIRDILPRARVLYLSASSDAIEDFRVFGTIIKTRVFGCLLYQLWVDARFDFYEVVRYVNNYNRERPVCPELEAQLGFLEGRM